jgi:serine/threonine protein kinase
MNPTRLGKYTLLEQLGKGGFGTVYKATDPIGRTVAIKVLKASWVDDPSVMARFRLEALAAGKLFHARIATILDFDEADGQPFLVMRFVDGQSLDKLLAERGALDWETAIHILKEVAEGLDFAHKHGFIHRDIKPANFLISKEEGAVLTDFGLAKAAEVSGLSSSEVLVGSPSYIAPEVWQGHKASPATDIYSLACSFYEMITGNKLFTGDSSPQIMTRHVLEGPKFPPVWPKNTPPGVEGVLHKALMMEPGERYPNAMAFVNALEGLKNIPVQTEEIQPAPSPVTHPVKAPTRIPVIIWPVAGLSLLCALACGALLLFRVIQNQASQKKQTAEYAAPTRTRKAPTSTVAEIIFSPTSIIMISTPTLNEAISTPTLPENISTPSATRVISSSTPEPTRTPESIASPTLTPVPASPTPVFLRSNSSLGFSAGGRSISMVAIGYPEKIAILVVGSIDGTQTDTRDTVLEMVRLYTNDTTLIPPETTFYLIPSINPDGNDNNSRFNDNDVDLNRNWGTGDWRSDPPVPGYADGKPGAGGSNPFSELETSQLRSLLLDLTNTNQRVILVILHSTVSRTQGEVFAGYSTSANRFDPESERLAKTLQTRLGYTYSTVWDYKTPGDAIDWCVEHGIPAIDIVWPKKTPPTAQELISALSTLSK